MFKTGLAVLRRNVQYSNPTNVQIRNYTDDNEGFFLDPTNSALQKGSIYDVSVRADLKLVYRF